MSAKRRPRRLLGIAATRLIIMAIVGIAVGVTVGILGDWTYAPVAGWVAAALTYVIAVWTVVLRFDAAATETHATREDPGIIPGELLVLTAAIASVVAVVLLVLDTRTGGEQLAAAALGFASVALSWALIHTLYTLRYARIYYAHPVGGIDFNGNERPRYVDFAYVSFDLGMTYQISDTSLRTSQLRGVVLGHTLLSYAFGTLVLASTINLIVGLA
ncbi:DUF1345 domain-containing protein [Schumannella sp. 10F1B-5-1]|uniref:DUF1345 domain-containing protein n=1 Tax=Schumannella sp. 10F1B-5-1 TaxID=2590780 RepID=UPI001130B6FC|nr:DUF1345 domain-containing protein [Schumannella sp. 10F1B-5-1]TPW70858.1 DUF1345 domain-containing protein [Schumannella sp. 10F1B-5-1]